MSTVTVIPPSADAPCSAKRDGNWMDEFGACKVCDGEIPHGHADKCDIYKLELEIARLKEREKLCETMDEAEKLALLRALQEIRDEVRLFGNGVSPRQIVEAVRSRMPNAEPKPQQKGRPMTEPTNNLPPTVDGSDAKALTSSEWVGVWEAALRMVIKAGEDTPLRTLNSEGWDRAVRACGDLERIVEILRCHTPTAKLSHEEGGKEQL